MVALDGVYMIPFLADSNLLSRKIGWLPRV